MPGSSLWLLPPSTHPLHSILTSLIHQTSSHFSSPHHFIPHITLTSEISPTTYSSNPQTFLNNFTFPPVSSIKVRFERLQSEDVFVRKLYIKIEKDESGGLLELGKVARKSVQGFEGEDGDGKAEAWAKDVWNPHLSLLYHDCPQVPNEEMAKIEKLVKDAGVVLDGDSDAELSGWVGGRVVLVPTDRPIIEWNAIAEREL